jgi:hypothetical protein
MHGEQAIIHELVLASGQARPSTGRGLKSPLWIRLGSSVALALMAIIRASLLFNMREWRVAQLSPDRDLPLVVASTPAAGGCVVRPGQDA